MRNNHTRLRPKSSCCTSVHSFDQYVVSSCYVLCSGLDMQVKRLNWLLDLVIQKLFMNRTKDRFNGLRGINPIEVGSREARKWR